MNKNNILNTNDSEYKELLNNKSKMYQESLNNKSKMYQELNKEKIDKEKIKQYFFFKRSSFQTRNFNYWKNSRDINCQ
jgi:hypothetical protein